MIDRGLFLKVRCAYIRTMVARGESLGECAAACSMSDVVQARLISMTDPGFDDGTTDRDIVELLRSLSPERLAKVVARAKGDA